VSSFKHFAAAAASALDHIGSVGGFPIAFVTWEEIRPVNRPAAGHRPGQTGEGGQKTGNHIFLGSDR
jgi:hypothetical protein